MAYWWVHGFQIEKGGIGYFIPYCLCGWIGQSEAAGMLSARDAWAEHLGQHGIDRLKTDDPEVATDA